MEELIKRIRADGFHPESLSQEAQLELAPPFEFLETRTEDRLGLRTEFALHRYMFRYLRGSLGPETSDQKQVFVHLTMDYVMRTCPYCPFRTRAEFAPWFVTWFKDRLQPSERRLNEYQYAQRPLLDMDEATRVACEPALTNFAYSLGAACFGLDENAYLANLRQGQALHTAGVPSSKGLSRADHEEAELAIPADDISSSQFLGFLDRNIPEQPSVLFFSEKGVAPDPLRVKTRLDSHGRATKKEAGAEAMTEATPEPADPSVVESLETADQVSAIRATLEAIRDREHPGAARRMVAENLLSDSPLSTRALSEATGRAFEGLRRAREQIAEEISRIV